MKTPILTIGTIGTAAFSADPPQAAKAHAKASVANDTDDNLTITDYWGLVQEGHELSADKAAEFETALRQDPRNIKARLQLIGYQKHRDKMPPAGVELMLGLIKNHPRASGTGPVCIMLSTIYNHDMGAPAMALWESLIKATPDDARVLGNAAMWMAHFSLMEPKYLAQSKSLFEKARTLEPQNPTWAEHLGGALIAEARTLQPPQSVAAAKKAIEQFTAARQLLDESRRGSFRPLDTNYHAVLAEAAMLAGDGEATKNHAIEALKIINEKEDGWNYGNLIHAMNVLLSRTALREGNKKAAADYLLKAGATLGSPQLNSFGPDFAMAREVLEAGERQAVLDYLGLVASFWAAAPKGGGAEASKGMRSDHAAKLDQWRKEIRAGKVPANW